MKNMNEEEKKLYPYQIMDLNDLEGEIWKDIEGYEGKYQVSNGGRVKSLDYHMTGKPQILKQGLDGRGYLRIQLHKDGKFKTFKVHRLVATVFIDNSQKLPEVNHRDEIKVNNTVENLEWCTTKYNCNFGSRNDRAAKAISKAMKGRKNSQEHNDKIAKAKSIPIVQIEPVTKCGKKWLSSRHAEREGGFNNGHIIQCCKGKTMKHKGYEWSYFMPPSIIFK